MVFGDARTVIDIWPTWRYNGSVVKVLFFSSNTTSLFLSTSVWRGQQKDRAFIDPVFLFVVPYTRG